MTEVSKERVRLLVDALRSEEYAQGENRLHRVRRIGEQAEHTWCCLGVASDVACKNGLEISRVIRPDSLGDEKEVFDGHPDDYLCKKVQQWFGFDYNDPHLLIADYSEEENTAATLNDTGQDFAFIANAFERTYLKEEESNAGE